MCDREIKGLGETGEQAVRAELSRLLGSPAFRTSKRSREFLEYVVEHTLNGPAQALKERSIGVELFQLPQDFDTGQRTIVRVTANEVRKKLAQHYLAENGSYIIRSESKCRLVLTPPNSNGKTRPPTGPQSPRRCPAPVTPLPHPWSSSPVWKRSLRFLLPPLVRLGSVVR